MFLIFVKEQLAPLENILADSINIQRMQSENYAEYNDNGFKLDKAYTILRQISDI